MYLFENILFKLGNRVYAEDTGLGDNDHIELMHRGGSRILRIYPCNEGLIILGGLSYRDEESRKYPSNLYELMPTLSFPDFINWMKRHEWKYYPVQVSYDIIDICPLLKALLKYKVVKSGLLTYDLAENFIDLLQPNMFMCYRNI